MEPLIVAIHIAILRGNALGFAITVEHPFSRSMVSKTASSSAVLGYAVICQQNGD